MFVRASTVLATREMGWVSLVVLFTAAVLCSGTHLQGYGYERASEDNDHAFNPLAELESFGEDREYGGQGGGDDVTPAPIDEATTAPPPSGDTPTPVVSAPPPDTPADVPSEPVTEPPTVARKTKRPPWWKLLRKLLRPRPGDDSSLTDGPAPTPTEVFTPPDTPADAPSEPPTPTEVFTPPDTPADTPSEPDTPADAPSEPPTNTPKTKRPQRVKTAKRPQRVKTAKRPQRVKTAKRKSKLPSNKPKAWLR